MQKRVIIFGADLSGKIAYTLYKDQYDIIKFSDNNKSLWNKNINGINIIPPEELCRLEFEMVIIASSAKESITKQINNMFNESKEILEFKYSAEITQVVDWDKDNNKFMEYVKGNKLDCLDFGFKSNALYRLRNDVLKEIVRGKKVIHLGCCDHIEFIEDRIKTNTWLQRLLEGEAKEIVGVDINNEAVGVAQKYSDKVILGDITNEVETLSGKEWDILLMPDVLEHIANPAAFLKSIKEKHKNISKLVVSVPNVFGFSERITKDNVEGINSDHRYWFSPYTLIKVMYDAGFIAEKVILYDSIDTNLKSMSMPAILAIANFK
ncbi:class I SAM-dependent methyltransferase [Clostridium saccharoperbutylacetonicum]|jgi:hypothetical protein